MILFGKNITSTADMLAKVPIDNIYHALRNPKAETVSQIRNLRLVRSIDYKRYSALKRQLPYIVCGIFSPPYRRGENFAYIEYFILDIDKLSDKQMQVDELRKRIETDSRVRLCFVSPSEDGLKVMFKLTGRCYDKGIFTLFYKLFAQQFARQYGIEQVVDNQTCDVTRACFISIDEKAYYNPDSELVDISTYAPHNDLSAFFSAKKELEAAAKAKKNATPTPEPAATPDVDSDVIQNIRAILNPKAAQRQTKNYFVPEQLNAIIGELKQFIEQTGLTVLSINNISYGKKIQMQLQHKKAVVNLFYGKRGYTAVISPQTGTDAELNELAVGLVNTFLEQNT